MLIFKTIEKKIKSNLIIFLYHEESFRSVLCVQIQHLMEATDGLGSLSSGLVFFCLGSMWASPSECAGGPARSLLAHGWDWSARRSASRVKRTGGVEAMRTETVCAAETKPAVAKKTGEWLEDKRIQPLQRLSVGTSPEADANCCQTLFFWDRKTRQWPNKLKSVYYFIYKPAAVYILPHYSKKLLSRLMTSNSTGGTPDHTATFVSI